MKVCMCVHEYRYIIYISNISIYVPVRLSAPHTSTLIAVTGMPSKGWKILAVDPPGVMRCRYPTSVPTMTVPSGPIAPVI